MLFTCGLLLFVMLVLVILLVACSMGGSFVCLWQVFGGNATGCVLLNCQIMMFGMLVHMFLLVVCCIGCSFVF